jgi:hypothetical protein
VLKQLAGRTLDLDWTALGTRRPPMWPGSIIFDKRREMERRNEELRRRPEAPPVYLIGRNGAGLAFAIDRRGRVVVLDEIEMDYPVVLAPSLAKFLTSDLSNEKPSLRRARLQRFARRTAIVWGELERTRAAGRNGDAILADLDDLRDWARALDRSPAFEARLRRFLARALDPTLRRQLADADIGKPSVESMPPSSEPFPFPPGYSELRRLFSNKVFRINRRKLGRIRAPISGKLYVFSAETAREVTTHFRKLLPRGRREDLYVFGNDGAGSSFAVDCKGKVVILNPKGAERPFLSDFQALLASAGVIPRN